MNSNSLPKTILTTALALTSVSAFAAEDSLSTAISPVTNPIYFESALIQSEVRPIYIHHKIDSDFVGGDANVYALQLRWAVTERLAIIATKDGYIDLNPDAIPHENGWADVAAGVKYAIIKDEEHAFILTPGVTFEIPVGQERVFQGNGDGMWNIFTSAVKGFGKFHLTGNVGFNVPNNTDEETANFHASLQADYWVHQYFIPLVSFNSFTTLSNADGPAFDTEGFDLINFGSSNAKGTTQAALGVGFRSRILQSLDLGFAFEFGVTDKPDIFDTRYTVDAIWRF